MHQLVVAISILEASTLLHYTPCYYVLMHFTLHVSTEAYGSRIPSSLYYIINSCHYEPTIVINDMAHSIILYMLCACNNSQVSEHYCC